MCKIHIEINANVVFNSGYFYLLSFYNAEPVLKHGGDYPECNAQSRFPSSIGGQFLKCELIKQKAGSKTMCRNQWSNLRYQNKSPCLTGMLTLANVNKKIYT